MLLSETGILSFSLDHEENSQHEIQFNQNYGQTSFQGCGCEEKDENSFV
jgi:hypothetical protein